MAGIESPDVYRGGHGFFLCGPTARGQLIDSFDMTVFSFM